LLQSFLVSSQDGSPQDLFFKTDGLKMYVVGGVNDSVYEYNVSTPWSVSTASFLQSFSVNAQDANPTGLFFRDDGLKMYVTGSTTPQVLEYDLSSAWNISTASFLQGFSVSGQDSNPQAVFFRSDGLKMYVVGSTNDSVYEYDLSSAWDVSTAAFLQSFSVNAREATPTGLFFNTAGTQMYVVGSISDSVIQYNLSSAWNISTAVFFQSFSVSAQEGSTTGLYFKPDGGEMYIVGTANDRVFEYVLSVNNTYYCITNNTDWEVGIGTVTTDGAVLYRGTVLESSNSNALVNWGAGDKDVFCTYPADATEGTVPQGDTSQVGTDLVAWTNLKKELDRTVINGVPYNNNNTAGVVSTFSLVLTVGEAYHGGVLAPNGDVHFIPFSAVRGQKVSATGVVSTYSLVYTRVGGNSYEGGVLASNGDIHFVPRGAVVGQKINASGVVSTYSLVYTAGSAYQGGVLASNGDIHFVPYSANRGQKVSAAGVVSTYSLVYTVAEAYSGGVLAPNGDIHFVPQRAAVGQKISAAGVVSTYSLVYTGTDLYWGGVLSPNGDIHFVPYFANRGQKINISGVVSTYSLAYTTTSAAYAGGVLAPNGDIYFIPFSAVRGQKVSVSGVVSTYSLIYTSTTTYLGGVLNLSGDIIFISNSANVGQKISTGTTRNVGYALSPFFNKF
jgi:hypothetical protein